MNEPFEVKSLQMYARDEKSTASTKKLIQLREKLIKFA